MPPRVYERFRKVCVAASWIYFVYMAYMLLDPVPYMPDDVHPFRTIHFFAFVALGVLNGLARERWSVGAWFGVLLCWACGSEVLQQYTGRFFEWMDMAQNVLGLAFGVYFTSWLRKRAIRSNPLEQGEENV